MLFRNVLSQKNKLLIAAVFFIVLVLFLFSNLTIIGNDSASNSTKKSTSNHIDQDTLSKLPLHTPELTPGEITPRKLQQALTSGPVCIVGYDDLSLIWISTNKETLIQQAVVCLITNVRSKRELSVLDRLLTPVTWKLLKADSIAKKYGIQHYPVLISSQGIEQ